MSGAAEARDRAVAFVASCGDPVAIRRAAALAGAEPPAQAVSLLDGRPPANASEALALLAALDDLRALHVPAAESAVAFLVRTQRRDGSWSDADQAADDERIFVTGNLAGHLAKAPCARPAAIDAAGAFLASHWAPERVRGFAWRPIAAYAHFFANVPHELADAALQWCGRELERGFRARRFDAVRTARVLVWCDAHALPGSRIRAPELVEGILAEQQADGGWLASDSASPPARLAHTLDALVALARMEGAC